MELFNKLMALSNGRYAIQGIKYNQYSTKPMNLQFDLDDIKVFNEAYKLVKNSDMHIITRTKSGGISNSHGKFQNRYAYDVRKTTSCISLTIILCGYVFVFRVSGMHEDASDMITPSEAFKTLREELAKDGINIDNYAISPEEGAEHKAKIPAPLICLGEDCKVDETYDNVNHIDIHNSYPSGWVELYPEWKPTIERLYSLRKENQMYKNILNYSNGCFQSTKYPWQCKWAHIAEFAQNLNNLKIIRLACELELTGHKILAFNTDGIWYQGKAYENKQFGPNLGQFGNDHKNCKIRFKSKGCYEYIEDGKYTPVVRGTTRLDRDLPRELWQWGDIYRQDAEIIQFSFDETEGIIINEKNS